MTPTPASRDPQTLDDDTPEGRVLAALREVIDPDLGINIVDLGFVLDITLDEHQTATITMTLTSAACPLTGNIEAQIRDAITGAAGLAADFRVNWIWTPAWTPARITDEGREQLRAIGFTM